MTGAWLQAPADKYGGSIAAAYGQATRDATATVTVAPTPTHGLGGILHPSEPFFAFAVLAALGLGLMAYSTAHVA